MPRTLTVLWLWRFHCRGLQPSGSRTTSANAPSTQQTGCAQPKNKHLDIADNSTHPVLGQRLDKDVFALETKSKNPAPAQSATTPRSDLIPQKLENGLLSIDYPRKLKYPLSANRRPRALSGQDAVGCRDQPRKADIHGQNRSARTGLIRLGRREGGRGAWEAVAPAHRFRLSIGPSLSATLSFAPMVNALPYPATQLRLSRGSLHSLLEKSSEVVAQDRWPRFFGYYRRLKVGAVE
jgi:hypothetical protein